MEKQEIINLIRVHTGKIVLETEKFLEVVYEDLKLKLLVEKTFYDKNIIVLQGPSSDIGNRVATHRIYFPEQADVAI